MQHSKSLGSLVLSCVDSDKEHLLPPNRPRKRSSLDTFLIPGRTRIPSQKSELFDVQVAQNLLGPSMSQSKSALAQMEQPDNVSATHSLHHSLSPKESRFQFCCGHDGNPEPHAPNSQPDTIAGICIPPRHNHAIELASNNPYRRRMSPDGPGPGSTLDGAQELNQDIRVTSTTWSTLSKVSRRIFSDSSDTSRAYVSAKYNQAFNELATKYGLQQLAFSHSDDMKEKPSKKQDPQPRRTGWFARKFLLRPSATYTYKARTTFKPLPRKKSFSSRSSSFSDDGRKNILEGKTLEETCKLGGVGVLVLPKGYCLEAPTLPACLSAAAVYLLNHGVNASGLFRISGQASIVNALYDYYAHQFNHAGSPTKVQTTIQPGQLPLHIEYTLPDVATFFKKVLKGLSGGLLGSLEIFEAVSQALLKLADIESMTSKEMKTLRAKMIAYSLLSITSPDRFNLIQAVLGLFAYLADQAEKTRFAKDEASGPVRRELSPTGLMGYQGLGVCLGPLLIGDLIENVPDHLDNRTPRISSESAGKGKKKTESNKLENPSDLNTLVDWANTTASTMQHLLVVWRDVVQQIRLATASDLALRKNAAKQPSPLLQFAAARNTIKVTDEELLFLKMVRGGEMPLDFPLDVIVKRKVKAKGKSSMPQLIRKISTAQASECDWFRDGRTASAARVTSGDEKQLIREPCGPPKRMLSATLPDTGTEHLANKIMEDRLSYRNSVASLDEMMSGQILPPREEGFLPFAASMPDRRSPSSPYYTPTRMPRSELRSSSTDMLGLPKRNDINSTDVDDKDQLKPEKAMPQFKKGSMPPPVDRPQISFMDDEARGSSRHSMHLAEHSLACDTSPGVSRSRAVSTGAVNNRVVSNASGRASIRDGCAVQDVTISSGHSYRSSRSNSAAGSEAKDSAPKFEVPVIPPFEEPSIIGLADPFLQDEASSTLKKRQSLIPKPQRQSPQFPEPSSKDSPKSFRRRSVFGIIDRKGSPGPSKIAIPVVTKGISHSTMRNKDSSPRSKKAVNVLQPLSAQSLNSLTLRDLQVIDSMPIQYNQRTEERNSSDARSERQHDQLDPLSKSVPETHSVTNSALFAEITRLKRQIEHKDETLAATRRTLEAATMAKEDGPTPPSGVTTPKKGSWNKGTLSHEVKSMKNQRDGWKMRAEWAEKRLGGVGEGSWSEMRAKERGFE